MMPTMKGVFVTGTDTGVGKTCVSAALLTLMGGQGWRTAGFKPVAAGALDAHDLRNEDVLALQAASTVPVTAQQVGPFQFRAACAPHLAASLEGRSLPRDGWRERARALGEDLDFVVAEGAGGFCVPLSAPSAPRWGLDDVAVDLGWPVMMVVGLRLGCLNHALLTAQVLAMRGLRLIGWVSNRIDPDMAWADDNQASLRAWLPAPCWGDVPWMASPTPSAVAACLDHAVILRALEAC